MTLTLHPECRKRLVDALTEALPKIRLDHGLVSDDSLLLFATIDAVLPREHTKIGLVGHVSDRPVLHFLLEVIANDLEKVAGRYEKQTLLEIEEYSRPPVAAERLVSEFETLPWSYKLFFRSAMPAEYDTLMGGDVIELVHRLRLVIPNKNQETELPIESFFRPYEKITAAMHFQDVPSEWDRSRYYFEDTIIGFISRYGSREGIQHFVSRLKAFAGFLIVFRIARFQSLLPARDRKPALIARPAVSHAQTIWLEMDESVTFEELRLIPAANLVAVQKTALRTFLPAMFNVENDRIRAAARWHFESYVGSNEMLSFVKSTMAFEIIFGDKALSDVIGIGKLIANRCAYLIGDTHAERETIIAQVGEIYATRSAIVHRGKEKLTSEERTQLTRLRGLCARSIAEELRIATSGA